jgi:hypothetical protein
VRLSRFSEDVTLVKGCSVDLKSKFSKMQKVETPKKGLRMRSTFTSQASSSLRDRISMQMHHDSSGAILQEALGNKVPSPMTPAKIRARRQSERPQGHDAAIHAKHNCENLDPQKSLSFFSPVCKPPRQSIYGDDEHILEAKAVESRSEVKAKIVMSFMDDEQVNMLTFYSTI